MWLFKLSNPNIFAEPQVKGSRQCRCLTTFSGTEVPGFFFGAKLVTIISGEPFFSREYSLALETHSWYRKEIKCNLYRYWG